MNKVILIGRLTREPEVRYSQGNNGQTCIARTSIAVDRYGEGADFINLVAWGKNGEWFEKYARKGLKIAVVGRITTGSYKNRDGATVYTTDITVESQEFCESKQSQNTDYSGTVSVTPARDVINEGFMQINADIEEELPFN